MAKILFKASSLTSTSSDLTMEYRRFSGSKQNLLPCIFLNAICWNSWGCSLILWIILKMCSCLMWNLLFLFISNQQLAHTFTIKFIKLWSFVVNLYGYAQVDKHMSLMAKVNHLPWFKRPIFQGGISRVNLTSRNTYRVFMQESLVTTEIMYFINFQNWIHRSANSGKWYLG